MTPRQQRMLDAIRECLARDAAWEGVSMAAADHDLDWPGAVDAYCEEASRTLAGVIEEVLREEGEERDAAVRALCVQFEALVTAIVRDDDAGQVVAIRDGDAAIRRLFPEGGQ